MTRSRAVLWAANVRSKSLDERLQAANAGGFELMSIFPIDYRYWTEAGATPADPMGPRLAVAGRLSGGEQAVRPVWRGRGASHGCRTRGGHDQLRRTVWRPLRNLGADRRLGRLRRAGQGVWAEHRLEFMPTSGILDLAQGWAVISGLGADHVRLVFDTWHFVRSGSSLDLIDAALSAKISEVQLVDGAREPVGDLGNDLLHFRRLPGEGDFPLAPIVERLRETGALSSVGPEVFADAMDALSAVEAGRRCRESLDKLMETAG